MTALDWGIVAFTLALGVWGYRQGLIVGFLTLIGFAAGAFVGSRLAPLVLSEGADSPYAPLLAALGALIAGALVAVALESMALGLRARLIRNRHHLHLADGAGGAALVACLALGVVWVFGAVALHAPGTAELRGDVQRSLIMRSLNELLPPSGPVLNALDRVDPAPSIIGPTTPVGPPDARIAGDPQVQAAGGSVLRVLGTACGLGVEGSGWVVAPGLVVTNAHVVAGEDDTTVSTRGGASFDATAVHYDTDNDLAILRISADLPPLPVAESASRGQPAAVLGYPDNGPFDDRPGALRRNARRDQRGLLRARPDPAFDQLPARLRAQRQLGRPDRRRPGPRPRHRLRDHDRPATRAASRSPTRRSRPPSARSATKSTRVLAPGDRPTATF